MYALTPPPLNLVVLCSPDTDRAASFYRRMGLVFEKHAHGKGPEHYASEGSGMVFEIYPQTPKSGPTTGTCVGFRVASVDDVARLLEEAGARVISPPADSPWRRRAVVEDFDRDVVELVASVPR